VGAVRNRGRGGQNGKNEMRDPVARCVMDAKAMRIRKTRPTKSNMINTKQNKSNKTHTTIRIM